jgi:hypothetical protein
MGQELPWHSPPAPFMLRQHGIVPCGFRTASAGSAPDRTQSSIAVVKIDLTTVGCLPKVICRAYRKTRTHLTEALLKVPAALRL